MPRNEYAANLELVARAQPAPRYVPARQRVDVEKFMADRGIKPADADRGMFARILGFFFAR